MKMTKRALNKHLKSIGFGKVFVSSYAPANEGFLNPLKSKSIVLSSHTSEFRNVFIALMVAYMAEFDKTFNQMHGLDLRSAGFMFSYSDSHHERLNLSMVSRLDEDDYEMAESFLSDDFAGIRAGISFHAYSYAFKKSLSILIDNTDEFLEDYENLNSLNMSIKYGIPIRCLERAAYLFNSHKTKA